MEGGLSGVEGQAHIARLAWIPSIGSGVQGLSLLFRDLVLE